LNRRERSTFNGEPSTINLPTINRLMGSARFLPEWIMSLNLVSVVGEAARSRSSRFELQGMIGGMAKLLAPVPDEGIVTARGFEAARRLGRFWGVALALLPAVLAA
jgi:hypothetical protein